MSDIIYEYTDEQAIEDGVLIPIAHLGIEVESVLVDRVAQGLWVKLVTGMTTDEEGGLDNSELIQQIGEVVASPAQKQNHLIQFDTKYGPVWAAWNERRRITLMLPSDY